MGNHKVNYSMIKKLKSENPVLNKDESDTDNKTIYETTIRGYAFTVLENGNIIPIIYFDPVSINNKYVKRSAVIASWAEFDRLRPHIGAKTGIYGNSSYTNLIGAKPNSKNVKIERPTKCPICNGPVYTNETGTIIRCANDDCGIHDIRRIYKYYMYCCLDLNIKFRHIIALYVRNKVRCIPDIYKLSIVDYLDIGVDKKDALRIIYNVETNKEIPIQNLYYSIIGCCLPIHAIKLASIINNEKNWVNPITIIKRTKYIAKGYIKKGDGEVENKNKEDDKLTKIQNILNSELERHKNDYEYLNSIIKVNLLPTRLPLCNTTFVIANLTQTTKIYLETVIRLNDGSVEDNFRTILWGRVNGIIGNLSPMNSNVREGIGMDTSVISESEFRAMIPDVKIANLHDSGYEEYDPDKYNSLLCESMDHLENTDTEETEDE